MDTLVVLLALVIFLGLVYHFGGFKALVKGIDDRGVRIAGELAEAKRLRTEAEKLLAEFNAKRAAAEKDAAQIVEDAKIEATRIRSEQEAKLADFVTRRTKLAEQKIAQAEATASAEVKAAAADAAIRAAETIIKGQSTGKIADDLIAAGLKDVRARLN